MNVYVGTSGYAYKEWKGAFYPKDLPAKEMLRYYGQRFRGVEINSSFYALPKATTLAAWAAEVPAGFRFAFKAPQRITHFQRLRGSEDTVAEFLRVTATLGERLGPVLFGLPPNLKADQVRLREFLRALPQGREVAFEFRHPSWFGPDTTAALREHGAALCVAEHEDGVSTPRQATAGWGYLRLRREDYTGTQLDDWAGWVREQRWDNVYVFFMHEDRANGPRLAQQFLGRFQ
ncbi:MAG: DUF72 domain-containing protein [Phycisphaerales bacterium]|nr:DUF72 domain-containing protein [Phycisphaerales bacterium]